MTEFHSGFVCLIGRPNTGKSTSAPFKTIGAITNSNHLISGDTVIVMPGTYLETVSISTAGKASSTSNSSR